MKLNEIKNTCFYTNNLKKRETIYEVFKRRMPNGSKKEVLVDTWNYTYTSYDGRKHYECKGPSIEPRFLDPIRVFEIKDIEYEIYGNYHDCMVEKKMKNLTRQWKCVELEEENKRLKKKLEIALSVLGQIAMFSSDKTDAVQCAKAIKEINEVEK